MPCRKCRVKSHGQTRRLCLNASTEHAQAQGKCLLSWKAHAWKCRVSGRFSQPRVEIPVPSSSSQPMPCSCPPPPILQSLLSCPSSQTPNKSMSPAMPVCLFLVRYIHIPHHTHKVCVKEAKEDIEREEACIYLYRQEAIVDDTETEVREEKFYKAC